MKEFNFIYVLSYHFLGAFVKKYFSSHFGMSFNFIPPLDVVLPNKLIIFYCTEACDSICFSVEPTYIIIMIWTRCGSHKWGEWKKKKIIRKQTRFCISFLALNVLATGAWTKILFSPLILCSWWESWYILYESAHKTLTCKWRSWNRLNVSW